MKIVNMYCKLTLDLFKEDEDNYMQDYISRKNYIVSEQDGNIVLRHPYQDPFTFPVEIGKKVLMIMAYNHLSWDIHDRQISVKEEDYVNLGRYCSDKFFKLQSAIYNDKSISSEIKSRIYSFLD